MASNEETDWTDAENWTDHTCQPANGWRSGCLSPKNKRITSKKVASDISPLLSFVPVDSSSYQDKYIIHPYEYFHKLSRINIRKSVGPDNIPNWILRDFAFAFSDFICDLFNLSIQSGLVPRIWEMANVVMLPKSHPPTSMEKDLRPISLTPTLSKILGAFIGGWMLEEICSKFDDHQFGTVKGRSTIQELVNILHICHQAADHQKIARAVFIDFAKAFDHHLVLNKMAALGVPPFITR